MGMWFGGKTINLLFYGGAKPHLVSGAHADAYAQHVHQDLTHMLSMRTSSLRVCSAWFAGTSMHHRERI